MNNMPNFIIVGASKSGTAALYSYLQTNPNIFLPDFKEPHYFARNHNLNFQTINKTEDYCDLFINQNVAAIGEASTTYLYYSDVPQRIFSEIPNCKIIAILRDPKERALSMWGHQVRKGLEKRSFSTAIDDELSGKIRTVNKVEFGFNYCKQGLIADHLKKYQFFFGKENVFIADYKMLRKDPSLLVRKICDFLEVEPHKIETKPRIFNASGNPKSKLLPTFLNSKHPFRNLFKGKKYTIKPATKLKLDRYFAHEIQRLDKLMN